jgi:GH24 family phage-related lysozyme (muramidase)
MDLMRLAVWQAFLGFTEPLEGLVAWFYQDIIRKITIGWGYLVDDPAYAETLPMRWKTDGRLATRQEIRDEWHRIKQHPEAAKWGGWTDAAEALANLRLSREDCERLALERLATMAEELRADYPQWDQWPADAQMASLSMCWAMGSEFVRVYGFTNWDRAVRRQDFAAAALACEISTKGNPGIIPRNGHNSRMFVNAGMVVKYKLNRDVLYWPNFATMTSSEEAPTQPELPEEEPFEDILEGPQGSTKGIAEAAIADYRKDRGEIQ